MNFIFGNNVPCVLLMSLVVLANAQRRDVDMNELQRQNKITKQILEAFIQKKLGIQGNVPRAPSILDILPVRMMNVPTTKQPEIEEAEVEEENQNNEELPEDQEVKEDDSLQSVESEQIDSIYNTQGRSKKYSTPPFEADLEPSGYNRKLCS